MNRRLPPTEVMADLSTLPRSAMGPKSLLWWGTFGFMLIEGTAFVLAMGAYLYLRGQSAHWPPQGDQPPNLTWGTVFTIALVLSAIPNQWLCARAKKKDQRGVRWGVVLMTLIALLLCGVRAYELASLNVRWDHDAYGSLVWMLMVLHTTHVVTDLGDTAVLGLWLFTHEVGDDQFSDVDDNAGYWSFVILSWLPIYGLVYWGARLL